MLARDAEFSATAIVRGFSASHPIHAKDLAKVEELAEKNGKDRVEASARWLFQMIGVAANPSVGKFFLEEPLGMFLLEMGCGPSADLLRSDELISTVLSTKTFQTARNQELVFHSETFQTRVQELVFHSEPDVYVHMMLHFQGLFGICMVCPWFFTTRMQMKLFTILLRYGKERFTNEEMLLKLVSKLEARELAILILENGK
jgi:hypothetical protein